MENWHDGETVGAKRPRFPQVAETGAASGSVIDVEDSWRDSYRNRCMSYDADCNRAARETSWSAA
jgi:hypothetical protein